MGDIKIKIAHTLHETLYDEKYVNNDAKIEVFSNKVKLFWDSNPVSFIIGEDEVSILIAPEFIDTHLDYTIMSFEFSILKEDISCYLEKYKEALNIVKKRTKISVSLRTALAKLNSLINIDIILATNNARKFCQKIINMAHIEPSAIFYKNNNVHLYWKGDHYVFFKHNVKVK